MEKRVSRRFFFETDLLYHLSTLRAVVRDVPIPSRYADEVSNLRISAIVGPFALKHLRNFAQRVLGQYSCATSTPPAWSWCSACFGILFGLGYAAHYVSSRGPGQVASAGVVMAAALPIILGAPAAAAGRQLRRAERAQPALSTPILRTVARLEAQER